jgi:hypothetical protein
MPRSSRLFFLFMGISICIFCVQALAGTAELSRGTILQVQIEHDTAMKAGHIVKAKTVYPVYVNNRLVLPAGYELLGKISELDPAPKNVRLNAKLGGDFTPLHQAKIEFNELLLPGGNHMVLHAATVGNGAEVVRFTSVGVNGQHSSLIKRLWGDAVGREKEAVRTFTAPGKKERMRRMFYSELPYHPELLTAGTQYSVELTSPLTMQTDEVMPDPLPKDKRVDRTVKLDAELTQGISSKNAVPGEKVEAIVTDPLFDSNQQLKVPQGSILVGEITQAHPAGKWGKGGTLRFSFRELKYPAGYTQRVHGAPTSVDADRNSNLQLDAEGGVKPGPKGIAQPLVMGLLAASAVHEDEASVMHTGGASNGFALIGRVAALASKSPFVGAGFGFYGTGRAVYSRFIAHGKDVSFPKDTRVEVVLAPERVNALKPVQ